MNINKLIKPKRLEKGDTIGFLTASGPVNEFERVKKAKSYFERNGYNVVISDTTYMQKGFLSADDDVRLAQIHEFFADDTIDAILCTRGGYGAIRLLKGLDYNLIKNNPKIFAGFSDATAFVDAIYSNTGLMTFYAPMPYPDFGGETVGNVTEQAFFNLLERGNFEPKLKNPKVYNDGTSEGVLWGGNMATLASMVGTKFVPKEKFILFLEDVNEPAYKIDRYLTQLMFDKDFAENLSGIVLGDFKGLDNEKLFSDIWTDFGKKLYIPIISGLTIGHISGKITIPIGIHVTLDTVAGIIV